jgi:predicted aspartyl protease
MRVVACLIIIWVSPSALASATDWFPVEIDNGQIIIPVTLNGKPAKALLDSGAMGNGISEVFLASSEENYSRGKSITVRGIAGDRDTTMINGLDLGIFGIEFPVNGLLPLQTHSIDFVIGLPFFDLFIVQIDYPNRRMRIIDRESLDLRKYSNVKMRRAGGVGHAQVRVELNGDHTAWLMFDTGNSGSILLRRSIADRRGWLEQYQSVSDTVIGVNGTPVPIETFSLPSMTIGSIELENVQVSVPANGDDIQVSEFDPIEWSTGTRIKKGRKTDGILGFDVLQHFVVTIDFKRSLLNLDIPR